MNDLRKDDEVCRDYYTRDAGKIETTLTVCVKALIL